MYGIVAAICIVFSSIIGFKAFQAYPLYKGSIYQQLFGSYAEYFWKCIVKEDASQSNWLCSQIGEHRLGYNSFFDKQGHQVAQFVTVFAKRGNTVICALSASGVVAGSDTGVWQIECDGKLSVLPSPMVYMRKQLSFLISFLEKSSVVPILAFPDESDIAGVTCSMHTINISQIIPFLKECDGCEFSHEQIENSFEKFKERSRHA